MGRAARARTRSGCRPSTSSPSRGSRARPSRRSGCPAMAWMPPYVAHVPTASTASAFGARRSSHSLVVIGWSVVGVVAEAAPVALALDRLVGDRALDDEHERLELAAVGLEEPLDEVVGAADRAALEVDQRPVHRDLRQAREGAEGDLLDARLRGRGEGDRVAVAAEPGVDPEDVDDGLVRRGFGSRSHSLLPAASRSSRRMTPVPRLGARHRIHSPVPAPVCERRQ